MLFTWRQHDEKYSDTNMSKSNLLLYLVRHSCEFACKCMYLRVRVYAKFTYVLVKGVKKVRSMVLLQN